jgi:6,7-dimethyl-8-ribityllumazine synthase
VKQPPAALPDATGLRFVLLRARFNDRVVDGLLAGAREALLEAGARAKDVTVVDVPGAFELPLAAQAAARSKRFDAIVALGAVIRGETDHYEHIAREAASGLAAVGRETGVPVGFGVLTVGEEGQALSRSAPGPENKGGEAARAAVAMVHVLRGLTETTETQRHRAGKASRRSGKTNGKKKTRRSV